MSAAPLGTTPASAIDGPAPETEIAWDLVRHALWVLPAAVAFGAFWGVAGVLSAGYALALVCANYLLSATLLAQAARISLGLLMGAALFGFLVRMGLVLVAVLAVQGAWWFEPWPLGLTLIVTHLGLLVWELRFVSASLAFPGLKPRPDVKESTPS